jgi:hypothetical protein
MKRTLVILTAVVIAVAGLRGQAATILKVKAQPVNVRAKPDIASPIVKQLSPGTLLESTRKIGDWYEILVADDKGASVPGYVNAGFVDVVGGSGGAFPSLSRPSASTAAPGGGQPSRPSAMIILGAGLFMPGDEIFKTVYGQGPSFGGEIRVRAVGEIYLSVAGGYFKKTGALTETGEETTMTLLPIDALIVFSLLSGSLRPYAGAGLAACKYTEENVLGTVSEWGTGFGACGGVTWRWRSLALDARIKYSSIKVQPLDDPAGLGGLTLRLGIGFIF